MKVGVVKNIRGNDYITSCTCGTVGLHYGIDNWTDRNNLDKNTVCEGCGNTFWVKLDSNTKRSVFPHIEVLNKSRKGFKAKRINLSVFHDDEYNVFTKKNMVQILIYDIVNNEIKYYKNNVRIDVSTRWDADRDIAPFFQKVNHAKFLKMVTTPETEAIFDFVWDRLCTNRGRGRYSQEKKINIGLINLFNYQHIHILANAGFPNLDRFYNSNSLLNKNGKNPTEILKVPKFLLKYIRENANIGCYNISEMRKALDKVDHNRFKELLEIVKDESTVSSLCQALDVLIDIHETYQYNNLKKLTLYLFREIRLTQGITSPSNGTTLLRDYIKMATKLGLEYDKYPKSLKKEHDIMQMNYKVQESEKKRTEFMEAIQDEGYQKMKWKKKDFTIITPKEMDDLIKEGNELSHCVASYVDSVISKNCKILFLRKSDDLDTPIATIEVRNENVRQARGYANRVLKQSEQKFVAEWAEKKGLKLNYYYR